MMKLQQNCSLECILIPSPVLSPVIFPEWSVLVAEWVVDQCDAAILLCCHRHSNLGRCVLQSQVKDLQTTPLKLPSVSLSPSQCPQRKITRWWFQIFFYVHPYLGKISNLTSIFFRWVAQPPTRSGGTDPTTGQPLASSFGQRDASSWGASRGRRRGFKKIRFHYQEKS